MIDALLNLFFPERCRGCGMRGSALCMQCTARLPLSATIAEPAHAFALYDYGNDIVRQAVWELKYQRKSSLMKALATGNSTLYMDWMTTMLQSPIPMHIYIVPMPQHYTKTVVRGFNQSEVIARWITAAIPHSTYAPLLQKTRSTEAQSHTVSRAQRQKNLKHSMSARRGTTLSRTALYIVVDDVITTGSTVCEASRALRAAGAKHVCAIAIAHGYAQR